MAKNLSCIPSSAITSSRMSRNIVQPCISAGNPANGLSVDWAGDPATVIDPDTGEFLKAYVFVGVMTYSQYAYVEAFLDMNTCTVNV
jgi:hypothetical protein